MCHLTSLTKSATKLAPKNSFNMVFHPPGIVVEIAGTEASDQGRSCEEHPINCGEVLEPDVVVRLRKVQLMVEGREGVAIAAIWVTDGMDRLPPSSHGQAFHAL